MANQWPERARECGKGEFMHAYTVEDLESILFVDIETVPAHPRLSEVPRTLRELWVEQNAKKRNHKADEEDEDSDESSYLAAGLRAEYGKVICISLGRFDGGTEESNFRIRSLFSHTETEVLTKFTKVLRKYPDHRLCAHHGKGFDFPFLGKRFLINGLPLPSQLNIIGMKPWDVAHIDTNEMWAFGARGWGNGATLKLLCAVFGIPSPKDDIDGSQVCSVYYGEKDGLSRIVEYCEKDVKSLAAVFKKMVGL